MANRRVFRGLEPLGAILERMDRQARTADALPLSEREGRERRLVAETIDHHIRRALWRAERRSRKKPLFVRQGAPWVNEQRRRIALELTRWARSVGATEEQARAIAERAALKFPKDGIVYGRHYDPEATPRERGESPRQLGSSPRQLGTSPRQLGRSPRQLRERGDHHARGDDAGL